MPFEGLLGPIARESTLVAVLGELDPRSLHLLAGVHPRGTSSTALALLLDTPTWAVGPGTQQAAASSQVQNAARVLRAAGWQTSSCIAVTAWPRPADVADQARTERGDAGRSERAERAAEEESMSILAKAKEATPVGTVAPSAHDQRRTLLALLASRPRRVPAVRAVHRYRLVDRRVAVDDRGGRSGRRAAAHPARQRRPDLDRCRAAHPVADRQLRSRARCRSGSCRSPARGTTSAG